MKVLLANGKETVGAKPDGRQKGSKVVEMEANIHWVIENDESQVMLIKFRELFDFETEDRATYEFEGLKGVKLSEEYYGKISHAIHSFVEKQVASDELTTEIKVWEKIEKVLRNLSENKDLIKFINEF